MLGSKLVERTTRRLFASALTLTLAVSASSAVQAKADLASQSAARRTVPPSAELQPTPPGGLAARWIGALSAYRMKDYPEALDRFTAVAADRGQTEWVRAGANFWAARVATALGDEVRANGFLKLAAAFPHTFYGLIAERRLGSLAASLIARPTTPDQRDAVPPPRSRARGRVHRLEGARLRARPAGEPVRRGGGRRRRLWPDAAHTRDGDATVGRRPFSP